MLDFNDIQGNILRGYRSFNYARFLFFQIASPEDGTKFIRVLLERRLVTPAQWRDRPRAATNVGFAISGLRALRLDAQILASFPAEFQEGMRERAPFLGDVGECAPAHWDEPWRSGTVDLLLMCYSDSPQNLEAHCQALQQLKPQGVRELPRPQDAATLVINGKRERKEHFGFIDGLSNPDVEGVPGGKKDSNTGNLDEKGRFRKVPVGEFLLGHRGEGGEVAPMPRPPLLVHNGTFLVFRKLHQDVVAFRKYLRQQAETLANVPGALPKSIDAEEYLAAKMMGRWPDGSSLDLHPDKSNASDQSNAFTYAADPQGARCPLGAHVRRANPRFGMGFGGEISSRRRIIRRGIAYGEFLPKERSNGEAATAAAPGAGGNADRGIMFLGFNASIERQFEFTQRQWINHGDEFRQGDDADPIAGVHYGDGREVVDADRVPRKLNATGRMVIPGDERAGRPPFLCTGIPRFVTTRGGDYFFVPSMTGLRLLASGEVNPS